MSAGKPSIRRCAIYTRKSSEEGLEQDFNSLDAQREACDAYIRSQAGEGWKPVRMRYDDGGYSGGSMERPGLEQLLADIRDRKLDTVVVYKVDRLTRSLADFAKIVEVFDAHGVSFVSVTQQFNTTTSMGRLTLNMLLSFAQFEREVTGERIRDKIAASKQKGMWMGGPIPLGYEPKGRTLTMHDAEAETVRTIFRLYCELGNVRRVKQEADRLGLTTKRRKGAKGKMQGGRPFSRGHLYQLLNNPLYVGQVAHNGQVYEGQHPAIIDSETWDAVQAGLANHTRERSVGTRASEPSPLRGKLFNEAGAPLTPSHAVKSGRRYRYYVSRARSHGSVGRTTSGARPWRVPAHEIEQFVANAVTSLFADRAMLTQRIREAEIDAEAIPTLLHAVRGWRGAPLDLVKRAELGQNEIVLLINLADFLGEKDVAVRHAIPARIGRRGMEMRIVLDGTPLDSRAGKPDLALIKAIDRAHQWWGDLVTGRVQSYGEIAKREGITKRYVGRLVPLAFLAPEIVGSIFEATQPLDLTAETLTKRADLPLGWAEQKALLGFDRSEPKRDVPNPRVSEAPK